MRPLTRLVLAAAPLLLAAAPSSQPAECAEAALRFAVVMPAGDADTALAGEFSAGIALAVAASNDVRAQGAKRPQVETLALTAGDVATATAAIDKAVKEKLPGVVAFTSEAAAIELEAAARKAKMPLVLLGAGGPVRTIDPADPVLRVEPSAADRALATAELLRLRSGRSSIGLPAQTKRAWLVVEDAAWARAVSASLRDDDVDGLVAAGDTIARKGDPFDRADAAKAQSAGCDRVVVIGGPATVRAVSAALDHASWDAPLVCLDSALDGAAPPAGSHRKVAWVAATPAWNDQRHPEEPFAKHPPAAGKSAVPTPAQMRGFAAAAAMIEALLAQNKKGVLAAVREVHEGAGGTEAPLFDGAGDVPRWRWSTWVTSSEGATAPVKATYLPDTTAGLFLGGHPAARHRVIAGGTCVRVGFGGGADQPPRTIEADLATLGLCSGGAAAKADDLAREQILGRTLGKLSHVWGRNADGSARPALSFRIAFVTEAADSSGAAAVWDAAIAGDGPESSHGGISFPGKAHCQAFATFLLRKAAPLQRAKLDPPLAATDVPYLDGSYAWNTSAEANLRSDKIRALLDGVASTFTMKLSKEIGHLAGLSIDGSGDPRSVMVTKGGEGTSDEFAYFPPAFAKILERSLGRAGPTER